MPGWSELRSREVVLEDEVHHAGHGVGAVDGRGSARQDIDALDERIGMVPMSTALVPSTPMRRGGDR